MFSVSSDSNPPIFAYAKIEYVATAKSKKYELVNATLGSESLNFSAKHLRDISPLDICYANPGFESHFGLEGEAGVNDSLNGCQSRGRPSA